MRVQLTAVGKTYPGGAAALDDVSLDIPAGQVCVLLGASGSGKSTLLRCLNGLVTPSAGLVLLDGVQLTKASLPQLRRRIGMVHQSGALSPRLDVARNVLAGALAETSATRALLGLFTQDQKRRAASLVASVGLDEQHLARRAGDLSGGQQQRVGIARALMAGPSLVLADEPVASLDPRTGAEIASLLVAETRKRGATLVCSLHQLDLARGMADRIVALADGRIVFDGSPSRLRETDVARIYGARLEDSVA